MDLQQILHNGQQQMMLAQQLPVQQPYRLQNISIEISSTDHQLNYQNCTLQVTEGTIALVLASTEQTEKVVNLLFANISSVGIQSDNLLVFLQGQQNEDENCGDCNQEQEENPMPQILKLIRDSQNGTFNLNGNFTVSLNFSNHSLQVKKQTHQLMVGYLNSDDNLQVEENFMDEMISADQINEDGTINKFNQQQDNQQEQEDDSDQEQQQQN